MHRFLSRTTTTRCIQAILLVWMLALFISRSHDMAQSLPADWSGGDEQLWIASGYYYSNLLLHGDFTRKKWDGTISMRGMGSLNMHLGKLLVGLPLVAWGGHQSIGYYTCTLPLDENLRLGNVPAVSALRFARGMTTLWSVLCCLIIFIICLSCTNAWGGLLAVALLVTNEWFIEFGSSATVDIHYNAFLLCCCAAGYGLLTATGRASLLRAAAVMGIAAGCADSIKITGLMLASTFFIALAVYRGHGTGGAKKILVPVATFVLTALSVIYLLNPCFWPEWRGLHEPGTGRVGSAEVPAPAQPGSPTRMKSTPLTHGFRPLGLPVMYLRWNEGMALQAMRYEEDWGGERLKYRTFHRRLLLGWSSFRLEWVFLLIGIASCLRGIGVSYRQGILSRRAVPLAYFGVNYLFILFFMKLNWDRYYLPTILAGIPLVVIGIVSIATAARMQFATLLNRNSPSPACAERDR